MIEKQIIINNINYTIKSVDEKLVKRIIKGNY